jgi:hypothetical protein
MVHHASSARNEVGQAFLPVVSRPTPYYHSKQQCEDFPYLIFHFKLVIGLPHHCNSTVNQTSKVCWKRVRKLPRLVQMKK